MDDPDTFRQAGSLLALLHDQESVVDEDEEARETARALARLDGAHRIARRRRGAAARRDRRVAVAAVGPRADPRRLAAAQLAGPRRRGQRHRPRAALPCGRRCRTGPASPPRTSAATRGSRRPSSRATAADPREPGAWQRTRVREAIGTATWAFEVGDEAFEAQGHRMIAEALDREHR